MVQFRSFWGVFGWMTVPAPAWFYGVAVGIALGGCAIVAALALTRLRAGRAQALDRGLLVLGLAVILQEAFQFFGISSFGPSWAQGRYLFAILPSAAALVGVACSVVLPVRLQQLATAGVIAVLLPSAVYLLLAVIRPALL